MPTIYDLKPKFQKLLQPVTAALYRRGITANTVTVTACMASIAYGAWMLLAPTSRLVFLLLPLFMLLRMALNAVDGMLARQYQQQSKLGAMLNEAGDVVSDTALFLPFALLVEISPELIVAAAFLSFLAEFVGVLGKVVGGGRRYDGPLGKSDRACAFGALGLLIGIGAPIQPYINPMLLVIIFLLLLTVWNRARQALQNA